MSNLAINMFNHAQGVGVSSKYKVINTATVVEAFAKAGFELHRVSKAGRRNPATEGTQKHLLTFRHPNIKLKNVGDVVPEVLLKNSYDGSCAFVLSFGVYRLACANGLVVGRSFESLRIIHVGETAIERAINGAFQIASQAEPITATIQAMQSLQLSAADQYRFALEATKLLLPATAVECTIGSVLACRRPEDNANDLWTVFNRVQENILRGGVRYTSVNQAGIVRNNTSRAVRAIDRNVSLNKELWNIAETFLQKGA